MMIVADGDRRKTDYRDEKEPVRAVADAGGRARGTCWRQFSL